MIPKSSSPVRLAADADVSGCELSEAGLAALSGLDRGESVVVDSDTFGH